MSARAIAPIVGASQKTVDRDVRESNDSPAPLDAIGRDVAEAAAATEPPPVDADPDTGEVIEQEPPFPGPVRPSKTLGGRERAHVATGHQERPLSLAASHDLVMMSWQS